MTRLALILMVSAAVPAVATMDEVWRDTYYKGQQAAAAKDYAKAESLYAQALHQAELFGKNDVRVAATEQGLGDILRSEKKLTEAEDALQRAVTIYFAASGDTSPDYAHAQFDLAAVLLDEGKYEPALHSLNLVLPVFDRTLDPNDNTMALALCMQGDSYRMLRKYASAETPLRRCAEIRSENGTVDTPQFAAAANSLAFVYQYLGKYSEADRYFTFAENIREKTLGLLSVELAETLEAHAVLLHQLGREVEAKQKQRMAAAIRAHMGRK